MIERRIELISIIASSPEVTKSTLRQHRPDSAHGENADHHPELANTGILSTIVFALVVYQFFRELRDLRPPRVEVISLTATFLAGVSTVTAAMFIYVSGVLGFQSACDVMAAEALSLSLMAYLFLREMPETMVTA